MEDTIENKQQYLRKEILDSGYDGQEFTNFLISKKGEQGTDLENWIFSELQTMVSEFQSLKSSSSPSNMYPQQIDIPPPNFPQSESDQSQVIDNSPQQVEVQLPPPSIGNASIIELQCQGIEQSPLSKYDSLSIKISFPEKKPEHSGFKGLFSNKIYISFLVETEPAKLSVRRKYSDFEGLRNLFTANYPGVYIPPLPKKAPADNASEIQIEKRRRFLEKFLSSIVSDPLLKNSPFLYDFLSIGNMSDYSKKKKTYKTKNPSALLNFNSRSGRIIIDTSLPSDKKTFVDINANLTFNFNEIGNLSKSFKTLFQEIKAVNTRMLEISNTFNRIYENSMKNGENENLIKSYQSMKKLMSNWAYTELKQAQNVEVEVREYFKFVKLEYSAARELYNQYEYHKNLYIKAEEKLQTKKTNLYDKGDTSKWDIDPNEKVDLNDKKSVLPKMLKNETKIVENLKMLYHYQANSCKNEFNRLREIIGYQNQEIIQHLYQKNSKIIEEFDKAWKIFAGKF